MDQNPLDKRENRFIYIFLVLIIISAFITNIFWLRQDHYLPLFDRLKHLLISYTFYDLLADFSWKNLVQINRFTVESLPNHFWGIYPPAYYIFAMPCYFFLGKSVFAAHLSNIIYLIISIILIFKLGKLMHSERVGLLAALMFPLLPGIATLHRQYLNEVGLTTATLLAIYLLLRSESFTKRGYSFLFGLSMAFGFLVKYSFIAYILGPLLWVLIGIIVNRKRSRRNLINLGLALISCLILVTPWYGIHLDAIFMNLKDTSLYRGDFFPPLWSLDSFLFYSRAMIDGVPTIYSLAMLMSLFFLALRRDSWAFMLSFYLFSTYLILFFEVGKELRYFLPMLFVWPLGIALGVKKILFRRAGFILIGLLIVHLFINYIFVSWSYPASLKPIGRATNWHIFSRPFTLRKDQKTEKAISQCLQIIEKKFRPSDSLPNIPVASDHLVYHHLIFLAFQKQKPYSFEVIRSKYELDRYDFIILCTKRGLMRAPRGYNWAPIPHEEYQSIWDYLWMKSSPFELLETVDLTKKRKAYFFIRKNEPPDK